MVNKSNASPEVFGFDFQVNATIFLLLDNIKELKEKAVKTLSDARAILDKANKKQRE